MDKWQAKKVKKRIEYLNVFMIDKNKEIADLLKSADEISKVIDETKTELNNLEKEMENADG